MTDKLMRLLSHDWLAGLLLNRFDEMQPTEEEKMENRGWLNEHLSNVASFSFSDLKAMKEQGVACFPPSYDIIDFFNKIHHNCLAKLVSQND